MLIHLLNNRRYDMKYIKFDESGTITEEAPVRIKKTTGWIFGYNSPKNEKMLLEDGYIKYDGDLPITCLTYKDGKIIENMPQNQQKFKTRIYSKLKIRRALRSLGKQEILDKALRNRNSVFTKDWADSNEIDLDDDIFKRALKQFEITEETLNQVLQKLDNN